ncbi:MAG: translation initiation factor 2 [Desulfovibrio sp.]|nr:translation initiation factor 2 [Desulfovibrio sp.]
MRPVFSLTLLSALLSLALVSGCGLFGGESSAVEKSDAGQAPVVAQQQEPEKPAPAKPEGKKSKAAAAKAGKENKQAAPAAKGRKTEAQIKGELDETGRKLAAQAARTLRPSKGARDVRQIGKEHIGLYKEVDTTSVTTEMRPADKLGMYVGIVHYTEKVHECRGADRKTALADSCPQVGKGQVSEMIIYDGKAWKY